MMMDSTPSFWKDRFKAGGIHLLLSVTLAMVAAALVFGVWYPYPYRDISGGRNLFLLLVSVDVVLGPLITFTIFDRRKPRKELLRDLTFVGLVQMAALAYGLWSVFVARPVHLVFEVDRFRVVHAVDVADNPQRKASPAIVALPWTGPTMLTMRPFKDDKERTEAMFEDVQGLPIAFRPDLWQPYAAGVEQVRTRAKPVAELRARLAARASEIDMAIAATKIPADGLVYLPVMGRDKFWTAFLDALTLDVVGFMPLDPY